MNTPKVLGDDDETRRIINPDLTAEEKEEQRILAEKERERTRLQKQAHDKKRQAEIRANIALRKKTFQRFIEFALFVGNRRSFINELSGIGADIHQPPIDLDLVRVFCISTRGLSLQTYPGSKDEILALAESGKISVEDMKVLPPHYQEIVIFTEKDQRMIIGIANTHIKTMRLFR